MKRTAKTEHTLCDCCKRVKLLVSWSALLQKAICWECQEKVIKEWLDEKERIARI